MRPSPRPRCSSSWMARVMACGTFSPSRKPLLMSVASLRSSASLVMSAPSVTEMMGRPKCVAKFQSRWSPPGTAITAPVA